MIWRRPLEGRPLDDPLLEKLLVPLRWLARYHRYEIRGLERIPRRGRLIIAFNHSFATYDLFLFGAAVNRQLRRRPIGLADRKIFRIKRVAELAGRLGLVEADPRRAERALAEGNIVCVAPGGMREALRGKRQRGRVLWKNRKGFAELAVRTQTRVIVAACPNADQLYDVYPTRLTKWLYRRLRLPFVLLKGFGPTLLPKPVKLIHYVSRPLRPPKWADGRDGLAELRDRFHDRLERTMERLLRSNV